MAMSSGWRTAAAAVPASTCTTATSAARCSICPAATRPGAFDGLVGSADVVVDNYRVGVVDRLGIDPDQLAAVNPRIVSLSINAFGGHRDRSAAAGLRPRHPGDERHHARAGRAGRGRQPGVPGSADQRRAGGGPRRAGRLRRVVATRPASAAASTSASRCARRPACFSLSSWCVSPALRRYLPAAGTSPDPVPSIASTRPRTAGSGSPRPARSSAVSSAAGLAPPAVAAGERPGSRRGPDDGDRGADRRTAGGRRDRPAPRGRDPGGPRPPGAGAHRRRAAHPARPADRHRAATSPASPASVRAAGWRCRACPRARRGTLRTRASTPRRYCARQAGRRDGACPRADRVRPEVSSPVR